CQVYGMTNPILPLIKRVTLRSSGVTTNIQLVLVACG
ncbi:bacterial extracellular solute-binding s, 5 Middle family protein, partial [Vibrio parahaemolyticus V-223/04]